MRELKARSFGLVLSGAILGSVVGWFARDNSDPFVLDDPFWRDFWSGPPAAGVFALAGALVAFGAASIAAATARRSAGRQEWWDRAEWALGHVMSNDSSTRDVGLAAIEVLVGEATTTEAAMLDAVSSRLLGSEPHEPVDGSLESGAE